jgi:phage gp36-like protein
MKKFLAVFLAVFLTVLAAAGEKGIPRSGEPAGAVEMTEDAMQYCTPADLQESYGEDRIAAWSRLDPDAVDRAIFRAGAEIDGYLISGGYTVPLAGPPDSINKLCIDIAAANLIISAGVLETDPGGKAVVEEAKNARRYLGKVAEGKYKIPGFAAEGETVKPPAGGVLVSAGKRFNWQGY